MYSRETIRSMSDRAAREAAKRHRTPLVCESVEDLHNIPFIGDYVPDGWKEVESYFVDSSGYGTEGEPALTFDQFAEQARKHPEDGFAITTAGQFQVYVGRFSRLALSS